MAKYQRFEDLPVWQEAVRLYNRVLDLLEESNSSFAAAFCNQLERAALSVSNNIAEGFERATTDELNQFIAIARGSAGEVRSMMAAVHDRSKMKPHVRQLLEIRTLAESCSRQLTGWAASIDGSLVQGKRHMTNQIREKRELAQKAKEFRINFLRSLKPEHPLYGSPEARAVRGEPVEG